MRVGLALGELEHSLGSLEIDTIGGGRREFAAGGQEGSEVEDLVDLVLGEDPVEQPRVKDRTGHVLAHQRGQLGRQGIEVERDDRARPVLSQPPDQGATDLARWPW